LDFFGQDIDFTVVRMLMFRTSSQFMSEFINNGIDVSLFTTQSLYRAVHACHLVSLVFDFLSLFLENLAVDMKLRLERRLKLRNDSILSGRMLLGQRR
jgi:hypothetical protein